MKNNKNKTKFIKNLAITATITATISITLFQLDINIETLSNIFTLFDNVTIETAIDNDTKIKIENNVHIYVN